VPKALVLHKNGAIFAYFVKVAIFCQLTVFLLDFDHFLRKNLKCFDVLPTTKGRTTRGVRDPLEPSRRATAVYPGKPRLQRFSGFIHAGLLPRKVRE
jgi:hypothetical protein